MEYLKIFAPIAQFTILNYTTVALAAHKITKNPMILKMSYFQNTLELILFLQLQLPCLRNSKRRCFLKQKKLIGKIHSYNYVIYRDTITLRFSHAVLISTSLDFFSSTSFEAFSLNYFFTNSIILFLCPAHRKQIQNSVNT